MHKISTSADNVCCTSDKFPICVERIRRLASGVFTISPYIYYYQPPFSYHNEFSERSVTSAALSAAWVLFWVEFRVFCI